jgi:hypothetical protein
MKISPFEKKCLALNIGYDNAVCDGETCQHKLTCVRYMLHMKAVLEKYSYPLAYMVCAPKFNFELCYWKYDETRISQMGERSH